MSAPIDVELQRLGRASRYSSLLSILAAIVFVGALLYGRSQVVRIEAQRQVLKRESDSILVVLSSARDSLAAARCAYSSSRAAITAFHNRDYRGALALYDEALQCDPRNAYLLNLKAYSAFKAGDLSAAVEAQRGSLTADSTYAWGYMDLARFLCAQGNEHRGEAQAAVRRAVALRGDMYSIMRNDGELTRLCGAALIANAAPPSN